MLRFDDGAVQFRQRLVVSLLSHKTLLIRNIRSRSTDAIGLQPHEASFLRLIDKITNGSRIEINNTGTQLRFKPGILLGGDMEHECNQARSIGWFLEGVLALAPFCKDPLHVTFTGATEGDDMDPSVDYWKNNLHILEPFGIGVESDRDILSSAPPSIHIHTRARDGSGRVEFYCPVVRNTLKSIDFMDPGKIKRIRGQAISTKLVSSSSTARIAYAAKGVLQRLLPDIWIHTDVHKGNLPGLRVILVAETNAETRYVSESSLSNKELPEELGQRAAIELLQEIQRGGCIDTSLQSLVLLWMCLTPEDVSRVKIGSLSNFTIASLRLYKQAFGVEFKVTPNLDDKTVSMSCLGTGYRNMARATT